jgi:hypothetical protein
LIFWIKGITEQMTEVKWFSLHQEANGTQRVNYLIKYENSFMAAGLVLNLTRPG